MNEPIQMRSIGALIDAGIITATGGFPFGGHNDASIGIPHIRPFNVRIDGEINLDQIKSIPADAAKGKPQLRRNDIVFNNTNTKELVGKCALWDLDTEPVFSNHMTRIRVLSQECDAAYLSFAILHHWMIGKSEMLARAHVAQASIMGERFREIEIPWPGPNEQRSIARVVGQVREACRSQRHQEAASVELKRASMRDLFNRGLHQEEQKDVEFGVAPASWRIELLDRIAEVQTGVAKGRKFADAEMVEIPYLRVANVQDGHLDLSVMKTIQIRRSEIDRYRLQKGDVVLTEGGDFDKLGRGFIWRGELDLCVHQNHVFAVRPDRGQLLPEFFAYLAQSEYGKAYFLQVAHKTTNLACINTTKLKAFPVLVPSLEEQGQIANILDAIDRKINLHKRKRKKLEELFRTILNKLMVGEINVADLALPVRKASPARGASA